MAKKAKTKTTDNEIVRLPIPDHLEPTNIKRSLLATVRIYFYSLFNATSDTFRKHLASVGNKDSITGNRLFDRHQAVGLIKEAALEAKDTVTANAKDGDIYKYLVHIMREKDLGLRLRRQQYRQLTHNTPAE